MRFIHWTLLSFLACGCSSATERHETAAQSTSDAPRPRATTSLTRAATTAPSASTCNANAIAWTLEQAPGATGVSLPPSQAICAGGAHIPCFGISLWPPCTPTDFAPNFALSPSGMTEAAMGTMGAFDANWCFTYEQLPLLQPTSPTALPVPLLTSSNASGSATNPPYDKGLAQAKLTNIQTGIANAQTGTYQPFNSPPAGYTTTTYDSALDGYLVGEAELLFELEGEYLTPAQQASVWQMYLNNDAHASCEASWTPTAPAGTNVCETSGLLPTSPGNAATYIPWGTYMTRALQACTALASPHSSVGAATALASNCLGLASRIPAGPGVEKVNVTPPCTPSRFVHCPQFAIYEEQPCSYQPYRDQWQAMALPLIEKVLQGVAALPALQPGAPTPTTPDPSVQAELALIQSWYAGARALAPMSALASTGQQGTGASITYPSGGAPTIGGLSGMTSSNVGQYVVLSGSAFSNGAYQIASVVDAATVTVTAPIATADTSNGSIAWLVGSAPPVDYTQLWNETSAVMGALWTAANAPATAAAAANTNDPNAAQTFTNNVLAMNARILTAAVSPLSAGAGPLWEPGTGAPPLSSAPLLYLVGDTLQTVMARLEYAGTFHDFGCRFRGCAPTSTQPAVASSLTEMWQVLGSLGDPTALQTALSSASHLGNWSPSFAALQANHAATLQAAALDAFGQATYSTSLLTPSSASSLPQPAKGLAQAIRTAQVHTANYGKTGLLGTTSFVSSSAGLSIAADTPSSLTVGLQDVFLGTNTGSTTVGQNTQTLAARFSQLDAALESAINDYAAQQSNYLSAQLGTNATANKSQDLTAQIQSVQTQVDNLSNQIVGLEINDAEQTVAFGDFMSAFNSVANSNAIDQSAMNPVQTFKTTVGNSNNRGNGNGFTWQDIRQIAVAPSDGANWPANGPLPGAALSSIVPPGWMLNVSTSGQWSPTCAMCGGVIVMGSHNYALSGTTCLDGAFTGPSGFYVSVVDGLASLQDFSGASTFTNPYYQPPGAKVCNDTGGDCVPISGFSETSTQSEGLETTYGKSANYNMGLRSPYTPFPNAPSGALLLVQMTPSHYTFNDVLRVDVVQPNMSVLVDASAEVYLVDNDTYDNHWSHQPCVFSAPGSLTVNVTELEPTGDLAPTIASAMVQALGDIRAAAPALVSQGTILPDDMARLAAIANADLAGGLPAGTAVPPALMTLFNSWVEQQLVHIEHLVETQNLSQQVGLLNIQLGQYQQDVAANGDAGRIYALATSNAVQNMNAYGLGIQNAITQLLQLMNEELYPAAALKYPTSLTNIQTLSTELASLTSSIDWTNVSLGQVTTAKELADAIEEDFMGAVGNTSDHGKYLQVALRFPNPSFVTNATAGPGSEWPQADPATSSAVWKAATTGGSVSITISPQELYAASGGGDIPCGRAVPIIDNMALVLGLQATDTAGPVINENHANYSIGFHAEQGFATTGGLAMYNFADPSWLTGQQIYVLAGSPMAALDTLAAAITANPNVSYTAGAGLSPFSTIDMNFGGTGHLSMPDILTNMVNATPIELDLVMSLETQSAAGGTLGWIPACASAPAAVTKSSAKRAPR